MKAKFQYSRTYSFQAPKGNRKHFFFNMVERFGEGISFQLTDKDIKDVIPATIVIDGDVETSKFLYYGKEYTLRADEYIPKGYPMTLEGRLEKKEDLLRDAHLHTIHNRDEVEASKTCHCICCRTWLHPSEIDEYADGGDTVICPYCGTDAVLGDACGIKLTDDLLSRLNSRYFAGDDEIDSLQLR